MMKTEEIIVLALAAVAAWLIVKSGKPAAADTSTAAASWVSEIFAPDGQRYDNGWRYFSDGTVIDPSGAYYSGGVLVWSPK